MGNSDTLMNFIRDEYPDEFKTWDGFQSSIMMHKREGLRDIILVGLYNKPTKKCPTNLSVAFLVDVDTGYITRGDGDLVEAEMRRVYPETFEDED